MLQRTRYWLGPRRPVLWILLALLLYTLGGFLLAPWLVERQLVSVSAERADLSTSVNNIAINPYTLTFTMAGLNVIDSEAEPLLSLERLFVNFKLSSVVRRAWHFDQFHVIGLDMALERFSDGDSNIGVVIRRWQATAEPEPASEPRDEGEDEEDSDESEPLRLVIADLLIDSAALSLVDNVPEQRFETRVDALDLSVQNLSTLPDDTASQGLTFTVGDDAVFNWTGTSSLNPLQSEGRITLQGPYTGLIYEYFREQLPFDMSGGAVDASLSYRAGAEADQALTAQITELQLLITDTVLSDSDSGEPLVSLPEISVENGELRWPDNTVNVDALRLRGFVFHPVREQDGSINFVTLAEAMPDILAGLDVDPADVADESDPWQISLGQLVLEDWLISFTDRVPEQHAVIELGLNATLADISSAPDAQMRLDSSVNASSGGALSLDGTLMALPQLQFDGELALADLTLDVLQPYIDPFLRVSLDQGRLGTEGTVAVTAQNQRYRGNVLLSELALSDPNQDGVLFSIETLQINGVDLQHSDEPRLDVDEIRITSPYARVEIEEDGSTNIGKVLVVPDDDVDADANDVADATELMAIVVDRMVVEAARIDFADRTLPLPFDVSMIDLEGEISALSTRSEQPASINLQGQVGEFGMASITGDIRLQAYTEDTRVDLMFSNLDMPGLSPYTIAFAGRQIDDGRLDADLSYRIEDGRVTGDNSVVMRDLVLGDRVPNPDAMDLPLSLAVALLRDRDGAISLSVPVSGDLDSPDFDYGQVIREAISTIIGNIVSSPFRFLANLVGAGDEEDLQVIGFAPGSSTVTPPQRPKLLSLAEALEQRPQLQLRVPPVYSGQADEQALALRMLSEQVEERMSTRAEDENDAETQTQTQTQTQTASARRVAVLEQMMIEQGLAVEEVPIESADAPAEEESSTTLALLRLMHMTPETDDEEMRLDEQAYTDALREQLLEQQSVPEEALDTLATQRAEQVLAVITASHPELEAQLAMAALSEADVDDDGQIVMTLEVEIAE